MDAHERLTAWLAHNGHKIQKRAGREFVRVERKKHGPMKIHLRLTGGGWVAAGDRKSHRCRALERLVAEFNEAERFISGPEGDRYDDKVRADLAAMPDHEVQLMADYYQREGPLTLADVRRTGWPHMRPDFVMYPTLVSLVISMRRQEAYLAEPAKRDALMGQAS